MFEMINNLSPMSVIAIVVICIVLIVIMTTTKEGMDDIQQSETQIVEQALQVVPEEKVEFVSATPSETPGEIQPSDLLPVSGDVKMFDSQFPAENKKDNFLIAGYNIGINTVSSSLKNANQQLRSDPFIPRKDIGPWNQSTIMSSDLTNRKVLEIGTNA